MLQCARLAPRGALVLVWHSSPHYDLRGFATESERVQVGKHVHVRYNDEVVRFVIPVKWTLDKILKDAKKYFSIGDSIATVMLDLASAKTPSPPLHLTVRDLDPNPSAQFYFQLRTEHDGFRFETELKERLSDVQRLDYFVKDLRAKKITADSLAGEEEEIEERPRIRLTPDLERAGRHLEGLVRTLLYSKKFRRYMTDLRLPPLTDAAMSAFISSFLVYLAAKDPRLNKELRQHCLVHRSLLDAQISADAPMDSAVGNLRHILKTYLSKGAAIHATVLDEEEKKQYTDLRKPWTWYKAAREFKRHFIIHTGPTNSGKTYHALEKLIASPSGVYCGPLRLLAHEVYEKITARGVTCSLITGQQRIEPVFATHVACTIEMADTNEPVDVAVIDEFQMIGEQERGWAWTRALLGLPAKEIHLCGDGTAVKLVTRICTEFLGDTVEVREYKRLSPLVPVKGGLSRSSGIQAGDCVVAFSRKEIHAIKQQIEKDTGFRCCMVYGSLPPESRSLQAALFNDPNSGFDVLVASDAIGMGLNLNIRRVIFSSLTKFDGTQERRLTNSEIKQISGRAGRYGSIYPEGLVTCMSPADSKVLSEGIGSTLDDLDKAGLAPTYEQLEMYYLADPSKPTLATLLDRFAFYASMDSCFFFCDYSNMREIAVMLEGLDLSLKDMYTFCLAPADPGKPLVKHNLYKYAQSYAAGDKVVLLRVELSEEGPVLIDMPNTFDIYDQREKLRRLEELYLVADNYVWLSYRLDRFDEREKAFEVKDQVHKAISDLLDSMTADPEWMNARRLQHEFRLQRHQEEEKRRQQRFQPKKPIRREPLRQEVQEAEIVQVVSTKTVEKDAENHVARVVERQEVLEVSEARAVRVEQQRIRTRDANEMVELVSVESVKIEEGKKEAKVEAKEKEDGKRSNEKEEAKASEMRPELMSEPKPKSEPKELSKTQPVTPHKHKGVEKVVVSQEEMEQTEVAKAAAELAEARKEVEKWKAARREAQKVVEKKLEAAQRAQQQLQAAQRHARSAAQQTHKEPAPTQKAPTQPEGMRNPAQREQQAPTTQKASTTQPEEMHNATQRVLRAPTTPTQQMQEVVTPQLDLNVRRENDEQLAKRAMEQSTSAERAMEVKAAAEQWRNKKHKHHPHPNQKPTQNQNFQQLQNKNNQQNNHQNNQQNNNQNAQKFQQNQQNNQQNQANNNKQHQNNNQNTQKMQGNQNQQNQNNQTKQHHHNKQHKPYFKDRHTTNNHSHHKFTPKFSKGDSDSKQKPDFNSYNNLNSSGDSENLRRLKNRFKHSLPQDNQRQTASVAQ